MNFKINFGRAERSDENGRAASPTSSVPRRMLNQLKPEHAMETTMEASILLSLQSPNYSPVPHIGLPEVRDCVLTTPQIARLSYIRARTPRGQIARM
jgi:hypothetical protein